MGAREVHRVAVAALAMSVLGAAAPARAQVAPPTRGEPVVIVDLRPGDDGARQTSRAGFADRLDAITGLRVRRDPGLDVALSGRTGDRDAADAGAALAEARTAYGALDCATARPAAERAIDVLAARQAAGKDDAGALRTAWAYVLLCADHDGDPRAAQVAAARLRGLGVHRGDEAGISAATWDRFPEIDAATDRDIVELTVQAPAGAAIWIDHAAVGTAPLSVYVPAGQHVIAAAMPGTAVRGARRIDAGPRTGAIDVATDDRSNPWAPLGAEVARWRRAGEPPTGAALGGLLGRLGVRFAFVLTGDETARLWARSPGQRVARAIDAAPMGEPLPLAGKVSDRVAAWDGRAPDPDRPLLRDDGKDEKGGDHPRWWIYASIVGAVVAGGAVIYAQDTAQDRQRIEVEWP
jgi:hypothetical protein